jgi:type IV pilus assembly protein PilW
MNEMCAHNKSSLHTRSLRTLQRGYSQIELSVALVVALFLLNGMFMNLQHTRNTSKKQTALGQLQDEERAAMTLMTDVIQQAGYYPNTQGFDATAVLPPGTNFGTAGQAVAGGSNANGDLITVRYEGDSSNSVLDCRGTAVPNGTIEEMKFSVQPGPPNDTGPLELFCTINGIPFPLVANVHSLAISYGVDANSSGSANTYLPANQMANATANYWTSIYTVKIAVQFNNPLYGRPGQTSQYVEFSRVIGVMSKAGANVLTAY